MIFDRKPDFVNEQGTKWWLDEISTDYAKSKELDIVTIFFAKNIKGEAEYMIFEGEKPVYNTTSREDVGIKIDIMALHESFKKNQKSVDGDAEIS